MRELVGAVLPARVCAALFFADTPKALSANSSFAETNSSSLIRDGCT
jgi:hypothetical protein